MVPQSERYEHSRRTGSDIAGFVDGDLYLESDGVCPMSGPGEYAPIQVQDNTGFSESMEST